MLIQTAQNISLIYVIPEIKLAEINGRLHPPPYMFTLHFAQR